MTVFHYRTADMSEVAVRESRKGKGEREMRIRLVLHQSDDVMFRWHKHTPIPPLLLFSLRFLCSPPFFSGAWNSAHRLVNSTVEMLRISTNQGLDAPSHRYHSNSSQPQWVCMCVHKCMHACMNVHACIHTCMCMFVRHEHVFSCVWQLHIGSMLQQTLQWIAFSEFIYCRAALCCMTL